MFQLGQVVRALLGQLGQIVSTRSGYVGRSGCKKFSRLLIMYFVSPSDALLLWGTKANWTVLF